MESKKESLTVQQGTTETPAVFNFFNPVHFETMQRLCKMYSSSELVPEMYRTNLKPDKEGNPTNPESKAIANCMIAVEISQRIGASPLMIMQNMNIIYGRPSWASKFLIATVNTCGRFNPLRFKFTNLGRIGKITITEYEKKWVNGTNGGKGYYQNTPKNVEFDGTQLDNIQCICFTTARGSNDILESSDVDIKLALQERWYTKEGSKWATMTRQMLMYRAASFWTNAYAPELSMGMKTTEEIQDIVDIEFEDVTEKAQKELNDKANKKEVSIPTNEKAAEKPQEQSNAKAENEQKQLDKLSVESIDKAKEFLIKDLGVAPEYLKDEATIYQVAREHGFEIVITAKGPGF